MPDSERRFWPRPGIHQHILGEVREQIIGTHKVQELLLYEEATERDKPPAEQPKIFCRIIGDVEGINCSICGYPAADWHLGEFTIQALLENHIRPRGIITKEEARRMG